MFETGQKVSAIVGMDKIKATISIVDNSLDFILVRVDYPEYFEGHSIPVFNRDDEFQKYCLVDPPTRVPFFKEGKMYWFKTKVLRLIDDNLI